MPVKNIGVVGKPLHNAWPLTDPTTGVGLTVIVKLSCGPVQPLADGVMVMVATVGVLPLSVAIKELMLSIPLCPRPMVVSEFVQAYVVPLTDPVKCTAVVAAPLHKSWLPVGKAPGVGLTVILKLRGVPAQPLADGVTTILPLIGAEVILVVVKAIVSPEPPAGKPIAGLEFIHV